MDTQQDAPTLTSLRAWFLSPACLACACAPQVYKVETAGDCYIVAGGLMMEDEDGFVALDRESSPQEGAQRVMAFAQVCRQLCAQDRDWGPEGDGTLLVSEYFKSFKTCAAPIHD